MPSPLSQRPGPGKGHRCLRGGFGGFRRTENAVLRLFMSLSWAWIVAFAFRKRLRAMTRRPAFEIWTGILTAFPEGMLKPAWPSRRRFARLWLRTRTFPFVTSVSVPMQEPNVARGQRTEM